MSIRVKEVKVDLDKNRSLRYDLNAFAELEELGMGTTEEVIDAMEKGSLRALRAILWAGLVHEDEGLTLKDVGKMLDIGGVERIASDLKTAIMGAMPEPDGDMGK